MKLIKPMEQPEAGGWFPRLVNSLRGAYGGILMVGVLTGLAGQALISPYSIGGDRSGGQVDGRRELPGRR
jgi:hypothetical protein